MNTSKESTDNNMSNTSESGSYNNDTSESGSTSNDDAFDEFLLFLSPPPPQTRTPTGGTEREIVIEEEKDEDEGTHHTSNSNTISASATPLKIPQVQVQVEEDASTTGSFHTADELDIDSSWPTSTSCVPEVKSNNNTPRDIKDIEIRTIGRRLSWSANDTVITDLETGRTPNYHHQHTETDTSSSNPDPFIVEAFQRYDTDGNGELSLDELKELLRSLALTMEYDENFLDRWIQKIDKDGNGSIDFEEFLSIFKNMKENSAMDIDQLLLETFQQVRKIFYISFYVLYTSLVYIVDRNYILYMYTSCICFGYTYSSWL